MKTPQTYTDATGKQWQPNTPYPMPLPIFPISCASKIRYWNEITKEWIAHNSIQRGVDVTHWIIVPPLPEPKTREELDREQAREWVRAYGESCPGGTWNQLTTEHAYLAGLAAGRGELLDRVMHINPERATTAIALQDDVQFAKLNKDDAFHGDVRSLCYWYFCSALKYERARLSSTPPNP